MSPIPGTMASYSYDRSAAQLPTPRLEALASAFANFVMGQREWALDELKYLAKVLPEVQMEVGGQHAKEFEALRGMMLMAMKRNLGGLEFKAASEK